MWMIISFKQIIRLSVFHIQYPLPPAYLKIDEENFTDVKALMNILNNKTKNHNKFKFTFILFS